MKKKICLALSLALLMGFSIPAYASTTDTLTIAEIESALTSFASDATEHLILNAERYDVRGTLDDFYYGMPFYSYLLDEDDGSWNLNKSILYYPLIADNKVESILTIGKTENGSLFCTIGKDFSDELNNHLDDNFICIGNGIDVDFIDRKQTLTLDESIQDFSDGLVEVENLFTPCITKDELELSVDNTAVYSVGPNGGTLTNFPKIKQSTPNTCASACLLAVARYLHPTIFSSWTDQKIHKLQQSNINVGLTTNQFMENIDYVLNNVGGDDYTIKKTGRLTTNGIINTLYDNELPAFAGYSKSSGDGHFVALCGFSKSGSNNFSAEFMDPATGSYKYSTAYDTDFAITWGASTYYWKQTITIS